MVALLDFNHFISSYGYAAIFLLSVLQSCCIPTSSELTIGFAGVLASQGKLSLVGVIAVAVAGEVVGAYIAWAIGRYAGRGFVDRYGRYVLLTHHDLDRAEDWYHRHGAWGVFVGRLVPVIRNFVAVPAGVAEYPLVPFGVLTFLGSLVWLSTMALIGYGVGSSYHKVMKGFNYAGYIVAVAAVVAIAFVVAHRYRAYKAATAGGANERRATSPTSHDPAPGAPRGARATTRPPAGSPAAATVPPASPTPGPPTPAATAAPAPGSPTPPDPG
jgi:membrane protein DedA with SNARE-associated domain